MLEALKSDEYDQWLNALKDVRGKAKILVRVKRLQNGNPGQSRNLSEISEMKIDSGPGYRVYYTMKGDQLILLLIGGVKGTQQRDIEQAKLIAQRMGGN
jgi:putative addiction module killer protein